MIKLMDLARIVRLIEIYSDHKKRQDLQIRKSEIKIRIQKIPKTTFSTCPHSLGALKMVREGFVVGFARGRGKSSPITESRERMESRTKQSLLLSSKESIIKSECSEMLLTISDNFLNFLQAPRRFQSRDNLST